MANEKAAQEKIRISDRVKRKDGSGCAGTVQNIRHEISSRAPEAREKNPMIAVRWDNGTVSYFAPEGLIKDAAAA